MQRTLHLHWCTGMCTCIIATSAPVSLPRDAEATHLIILSPLLPAHLSRKTVFVAEIPLSRGWVVLSPPAPILAKKDKFAARKTGGGNRQYITGTVALIFTFVLIFGFCPKMLRIKMRKRVGEFLDYWDRDLFRGKLFFAYRCSRCIDQMRRDFPRESSRWGREGNPHLSECT